MTRYCWITDPHLNLLNSFQLHNYFSHLQSKRFDGIFLTGDVSTGLLVNQHLCQMARVISSPIYFVLGNHDYHKNNFETVTNTVSNLTNQHANLHYLNVCEPLPLNDNICVIGHDGWYDARWRDPYTSFIFAWDYFFIKDFRSLTSNKERITLVRRKADEAAFQLGQKLTRALKKYQTIYLLTHFPPWPENDLICGGILEKFWMPYNSSKATADVLSSIMKDSDKKLIVLSGHTHRKRFEKITDNIELRVGSSGVSSQQTLCIT